MSGNSLTSETSPYLLQHADNPVDWYPWSEAAFSKARAEAKPVLLSVGYSACHWCHVMAHESFEDEATARLMNEHFVNIKVDREERPDIDAIYMSAVQAMTGHGGWPMTVVMTPEGKPFFGGTYFPKEDRYGQPAFKRVLLSLSDAWKNRRGEVLESADNATQYLARLSSLSASDADLSKAILEEAATTLTASFDPEHGGFGHAPKFPPHSSLRFLLLQDPNNALARQMVVTTLTQMARGGIYDHLGGGFARYSVDAFWLVPHFEKMLYDNAQLVQRYAEAYQLTGEALFKDVIEETLDWVRREMTSPEGGFYSALDADSEGVEGKFYVWDEAEIDDLLGQDAALIKAYYDVTTAGNFEGHSILNVKRDPAEIAEQFGLDETSLKAKLSTFKTRLLAARAARTRPGLDDKILTSWNGLMLAAFADAGRVLGRQDYVDIAIKNATFIRDNLLEEGRLKHSYKAGQAKIAGLLEDYAYYGLGLMALYRSTLDTRWFLLALDLAKAILEHFHDAENGGFFSTPDDGEKLIVRPKNYVDSPNPSENAAAAELLLGLARFTDNAAWEAIAANTLKTMSEGMRKQAGGFGTLLVVLDKLLTPPQELALLGDPASSNMQALISVVHSQFMPHRAVALATSEDDALLEHIPFLRGRGLLQGRATAYVCEGGSCQLPVTTADGLLEQLSKP